MVNYYNDAGEGEMIDEDNFPLLQIGIANQNHIPVACPTLLDLASLGIPHITTPRILGQNRWTGSTASWTFKQHWREFVMTAEECYELLWLNLKANSDGRTARADFDGLTIQEIASGITIHQTGSLDNGGNSTFSVKYAGFTISHPFQWTTSGDLQVVGSSTGSSVVVKANGTNSYVGKVLATIPGCGTILEFSVDKCTNGTNKKYINGGCETGLRKCSYSEETGAYNEFGPIYTTYWEYVFSDGSRNPAGITTSNLMCNPS